MAPPLAVREDRMNNVDNLSYGIKFQVVRWKLVINNDLTHSKHFLFKQLFSTRLNFLDNGYSKIQQAFFFFFFFQVKPIIDPQFGTFYYWGPYSLSKDLSGPLS